MDVGEIPDPRQLSMDGEVRRIEAFQHLALLSGRRDFYCREDVDSALRMWWRRMPSWADQLLLRWLAG